MVTSTRMSVPAQDSIPQRQLVYQLALAIDHCNDPSYGRSRGEAELEELIFANPRSAFSTHVLHNIGSRRARYLLAHREVMRARGAFATSA